LAGRVSERSRRLSRRSAKREGGPPSLFDVLTDTATLAKCLGMLSQPERGGLQSRRLGTFGPFDVTLNLHADRKIVSIFIDGPDLEGAFSGNQSAGLYVEREEILRALSASPPWPTP